MKIRPVHNPLENRIFKYKNPSMEFYCPLCSTKRAFTSTPRMSVKNYFQCFLTTVFLMACLWPLMEIKSFFIFFFVWAIFEAGVRMNFRKEIPCPHCGFDASWYKRDVKMARKIVGDFWQNKKPQQNNAQS